jgi:predicted DNA-binding protein (MmcQ/YjbR family)
MVAGKMFCVTSTEGGASFKVTPEAFDELTEREGITPTAYMARNKWITVAAFGILRKAEWEKYISDSYGLILSKLPKKIKNTLYSASE